MGAWRGSNFEPSNFAVARSLGHDPRVEMRAALDGHKRTQTASGIPSREPNTMNSTAREGLFAGSVHNLRQKVKTAASTHRRRISMIPSERDVVDAVYNRPRMSKKSPQAFLFGQS